MNHYWVKRESREALVLFLFLFIAAGLSGYFEEESVVCETGDLRGLSGNE